MMKHTPGPWEYIASTEHHGPYVAGPLGGDICDCYVMSNPGALSVRNGGDSKPIHHQHEQADANARLIAAAPDLLSALQGVVACCEAHPAFTRPANAITRDRMNAARAAIARASQES